MTAIPAPARLRNGVKLHLDTCTEKVIELGIRPYRKVVRTPAPTEKPIETKSEMSKPIS